MRIQDVILSAGNTGFYFDDQRAIKKGARHDGFTYAGSPATEGFSKIRQAGQSVSVMLLLEDGSVAIGDAAAVQYSGAGGRDPLFLSETYIPFLNRHIKPLLLGRELDSFRSLATWIDDLRIEGRRLHTALRYGLSQAFLDAVALSRRQLKAEVILQEYDLPLVTTPIPLFGQTGDDRYDGVDKMIMKEVDVLPHGLINNIDEKLGRGGEKLEEYVRWLTTRIRKLRVDHRYRPALHIDVYGNVGTIFNDDPAGIAGYLAKLGEAAEDFPLHIEGPVDMEAKAPQIEMLGRIKDELEKIGSNVEIVADEWCNTWDDIRDFTDAHCCHMVQIKTPDLGSVHNIVDSILYCKKNGMESYQGGTCNETDISARACVHIAVAARPERILAKPGMGFDEGLMIVRNEMQRTCELLKLRNNKA